MRATGVSSCCLICLINEQGENRVSLANKLKKLRLKSGESLQQAADAVGISKPHFWELETGKSKNPSADLLQKLAEHFKISLATLAGEDPKSDDDEWAIAMFRGLKQLDQKDRDLIEFILKKKKGGRKDANSD